MAGVADVRRRWAWITGLRALLMLLAGLFAVIWPGAAALALIQIGGALLLVDGILGLWSLTFGGGKTGNYWFDVIRNVLAVITGALLLFSWLLAFALVAFVVYVIAFQAIVVGVMEIVIIMRERALYARVWPVLLSGALYVLFGIALLVWPYTGAAIMVIFGGVLAIVFAIGLFALAWRLYKAADGPVA